MLLRMGDQAVCEELHEVRLDYLDVEDGALLDVFMTHIKNDLLETIEQQITCWLVEMVGGGYDVVFAT